MKNIKIVLVDIDGTLLNSDGIITQRTKEAIRKVREKGLLFGIATGRPVASVERLLPKWGIEKDIDILLGFNGAEIKDYTLNQTFESNKLEGEVISKILDEYNVFDLTFAAFVKDIFYVTRSTDITNKIASKNGYQLKICHQDLLRQSSVFKMYALSEEEVTLKLNEYHSNNPRDYFKGVQTTPNHFEFLNPHISKSSGIKLIAEAHGYNIENVLVFGDEMNDYEMIRDCGIGVVMANGNEEVKKIADYVTLSCDEDGIAHYLEQFIL